MQMGTNKAFFYPSYNQNFDRLFQLLKEQKDDIGIEEIHIFLVEKDSVWNETSFSKYQKGILVSGITTSDCNKYLKSLLKSLSLHHVNIPDYQTEEFLTIGTVYPIE
jgi:hypothetical protein